MAEHTRSDSPDSGKIATSPDAAEIERDNGESIDESGDEKLSVYERKAMIVDKELNAMGMGKYQWRLFFLCGFGYMLDLLWAQAFGLITPRLQQELGFSDPEIGNIGSSFSAGLCAGAFVWGILVDIVGRRLAFNMTVLIASIFGLSLGGPSTYNGVIVLTAFVGIGVGGNIPIDTTITLEFLPTNRRFLLALLSIFQPLGVVLCCIIAYGLVPKHSCATNLKACNQVSPGTPCCTKSQNMGWRYLVFTMGGITLFVFFLRFFVFKFRESPKFLLSRGQDEKAVKVLHDIAKLNGHQCNVTLETFTSLNEENTSSAASTSNSGKPILGSNMQQTKAKLREKFLHEGGRYKYLFSSPTIARLTILVWIIYAFDYWGFTIAGFYLPTILARKNASIGVSLYSTYRSYILIYIFGIPGVVIGTLLWNGRRTAMLSSSLMMGVSLFIFSQVNSEASNIGINGMEYFFQSMFNAVLYGWTPEAFPASIRGTAAGVASFWGRLFSIVSPLIAGHLLSKSTNAVLYLAGSGVFVCTVAIVFLPQKYLKPQSH
ncbi:MAG: hypothetical protein Q9160_000861 [Pyrenula sp. 1 TL-2023]